MQNICIVFQGRQHFFGGMTLARYNALVFHSSVHNCVLLFLNR